MLSDSLRPHLDGIETADSVTIDAHKWMSVPMGAGIFFTPHPGLLDETYRISTAYMPDPIADTTDPYTTTIQWSRRFMGLKLFLTLLTAGRTGYQQQLDHDTELGHYLRQRLTDTGWDTSSTTHHYPWCASSTQPYHRTWHTTNASSIGYSTPVKHGSQQQQSTDNPRSEPASPATAPPTRTSTRWSISSSKPASRGRTSVIGVIWIAGDRDSRRVRCYGRARITTSESFADSAPQTSPGRPRIWRTSLGLAGSGERCRRSQRPGQSGGSRCHRSR